MNFLVAIGFSALDFILVVVLSSLALVNMLYCISGSGSVSVIDRLLLKCWMLVFWFSFRDV